MALQAQFGRYHIIERLGKGGMATVYKAYDPSFKREVALKLLPDELQDDPTLRARFEREAQAIAGLELPAIVPVFDLGEQNGQLYLVMQVMTGGSLADRLRGGALPSDESADIIGRLAPALDEAHQRGLIHRDIKPANILFDQSRLAYLSDFGIVKRSADTNELTGDFIIGTPTYMAPEMATQSGQITPAADIYMLGAVLYEMLTGSPPYSGDHAMQVLLQHINAPIPDPRHIRPDLPGRVSGVIRQALAKQPGDRYPTAQALADDLQAALAAAPGKETQPSGLHRRAIVPEDALTTDGPVVVPERPIDVGPPVAQPEPGRKRSRIPGWLFIVGILAVVLVGLVIVFSSAVGTLIEQSNLTQQAQKQLRETAYFEQTADALFSSAQQTIQAQTAEARAVQAIADANATAQAEATGTALEQAAATQQMQATQNAAAERLAGARRGEVIFEPQTKDLPHKQQLQQSGSGQFLR
jgi:serine/threonine protein kinase